MNYFDQFFKDNTGKYVAEKMQNKSKERKRIQQFFENSQIKDSSGYDFTVEHIYKVQPKRMTRSASGVKPSKYLFHGTKTSNLRGILERGFRDKMTKSGCCGHQGTYLSNVSAVASVFGQFKFKVRKLEKHCTCVIVCSILDESVVEFKREVKHKCQPDKRKRQHPVEKFNGIKTISETYKFEYFIKDDFKKEMSSINLSVNCRSFDKYLVGQHVLKPEYIVFASKSST